MQLRRTVSLIVFLAALTTPSMATDPATEPVTATFSIVAFDPLTREWGVGVASRVLAVGYIVPWARAEVGAVATQAYTDVRYGRYGLELLDAGFTAEQTLAVLLEFDEEAEYRQVAIIDAAGRIASFTGEDTLEWSGDRQGENYSVQGNILVGEEVLVAMERAFLETDGPLARRLVAALAAGDKVGGDSRGKQSAALLVVRERGGYQALSDCLVDISVDDHTDPVAELERIYYLWEPRFMLEPYLNTSEKQVLSNALDIIVRVLAEEEGDAQVRNDMAWGLAVRGLYLDFALDIALDAHELEPNDPNILDTVAETYYALGDPEVALEWENRALELDPVNTFFLEQRMKFITAIEGGP